MSSGMLFDNQQQSWFASLLEDTQDLDRWLIFADWLEDHDHPQAEVTRLWARQRWNPGQWRRDQEARLIALLNEGLRPCLPRYVNSLGMSFVLVPKGSFWMSENGKNAQKPVRIDYDFYMGIYPVTQGQWQEWMGENPSWFSRSGEGKDKVKDLPDTDLRYFPVEQVSWKEMQLFAKLLNDRESVREKWKYGLPTEVEWEYSCREGASSKEECSFDIYLTERTDTLSSNLANFKGDAPLGNAPKGPILSRTTKVGTYPPNRLGIYDMHGNVRESCEDLFGEEFKGGSNRVFRGGSFYHDGSCCRVAYRFGCGSVISSSGLGFRIAMVPSERNPNK